MTTTTQPKGDQDVVADLLSSLNLDETAACQVQIGDRDCAQPATYRAIVRCPGDCMQWAVLICTDHAHCLTCPDCDLFCGCHLRPFDLVSIHPV